MRWRAQRRPSRMQRQSETGRPSRPVVGVNLTVTDGALFPRRVRADGRTQHFSPARFDESPIISCREIAFGNTIRSESGRGTVKGRGRETRTYDGHVHRSDNLVREHDHRLDAVRWRLQSEQSSEVSVQLRPRDVWHVEIGKEGACSRSSREESSSRAHG